MPQQKPKKPPKKPPTPQMDHHRSALAIPPTPMCTPLQPDGEDVLLLSSISVAQWKASLGRERFEDRFTNVLDAAVQDAPDGSDTTHENRKN